MNIFTNLIKSSEYGKRGTGFHYGLDAHSSGNQQVILPNYPFLFQVSACPTLIYLDVSNKKILLIKHVYVLTTNFDQNFVPYSVKSYSDLVKAYKRKDFDFLLNCSHYAATNKQSTRDSSRIFGVFQEVRKKEPCRNTGYHAHFELRSLTTGNSANPKKYINFTKHKTQDYLGIDVI